MTDLVDALVAAPVGVALLGRLEARHHEWPHEVPDGSSPDAVAAAIDDVHAMTIGELLSIAVEAGYYGAGPWSGSAKVELLRAYRDAPWRAALAQAVAARLPEADLEGRQEWWHTNHRAEGWFAQPRFGDLDARLYDDGEFTFNGLWTVTAPPPATHHAMASAWELDESPISRWHLPVRDDARVFEIDGPGDWVDLVARFALVPTRANTKWELPGVNDHLRDPRLAELSYGRAARNEIDHRMVPQWSRVAQNYDGVHLTWRGWLTSEGYVSDTPDGGVTMLRYWFSERTLWLRDVFGEPEPLPAPSLEPDAGVDVATAMARRDQDRAVLRALLGR